MMMYKAQFKPNATEEDKVNSDKASVQLLKRFAPLFKKYLVLLKTAKIDFEDREQKAFVKIFIGDKQLKNALKRDRITAKFRHPIMLKFNFIKETYGSLSEDEILTDLYTSFFTLLKRYKQMGKNFCAYLHRSYNYEVGRHIMKFTKNPANIPYRTVEYEEYMESSLDGTIESCFEDSIYENNMGIPDISWINGSSCSDIFACLTNLERKLLIKYYIEDYNDRQIAEEFGMRVNNVNQKRRRAVVKLAVETGVDITKIKRSRKSGKKALKFRTETRRN